MYLRFPLHQRISNIIEETKNSLEFPLPRFKEFKLDKFFDYTIFEATVEDTKKHICCVLNFIKNQCREKLYEPDVFTTTIQLFLRFTIAKNRKFKLKVLSYILIVCFKISSQLEHDYDSFNLSEISSITKLSCVKLIEIEIDILKTLDYNLYCDSIYLHLNYLEIKDISSQGIKLDKYYDFVQNFDNYLHSTEERLRIYRLLN